MIDAGLLDLVRDTLEGTPRLDEKKMFGGMAFLRGGNLFLGVRTGRLMVRVGPDRYDEALALPGVRPMIHSGRAMRGYVFVDTEGLDEDALRDFVKWGLAVAVALPPKPAATKRPAAAKKPAGRPAKKR